MANWCNNFITLEGTEIELKKFDDLIKSAKVENEYCVSLVKNGFEVCMFDYYEVNDYVYQFQTKWSPHYAFEYLLEASKDFADLVITLSFEEFGCNLFGVYIITNGTFKLKELSESDFDLIVFDEENETYSYKDFESDSESEVCEYMLSVLY
jgi:hypothetical protein